MWFSQFQLSQGNASTTGCITAVSRIPNSMEVFWIEQNGSVQGAFWYDGGNWSRYELAPAGSASATGSITAVSRIPNSMEVFWIAQNGSVQDAYWYEGANWQHFELAPAGSASATGSITAVSRISNSMEVFWVGQNGSVQDAYWYEGANWQHFELAPAGSASATGSIKVVSRIPNSMELWWIGESGSIQDAYWYDLVNVISSWAILLVKFKDDVSPLPNLTLYEDLFTSVGSGKLNMTDFFRDVSHGQVDTSSTKLFGWYTLDQNRGDYIGNSGPVSGKINRGGLLDAAKTKAITAGVALNNFAGVVVSVLGVADLCGFIGGMAAICDSNSLQPSLLGQEMGHGYGLDHARIQGSEDDYQDPWDIMSTANAYESSNNEFTDVGPGMNAWNMRSRGWLNESRVWKSSNSTFNVTLNLSPLHRFDLSNFLAAEIGEYLVELRVKELWDAAIPRACILIHRFENNHSYLMPAISGSHDIPPGDKFVSTDNKLEVDVISIDELNKTASIRLIKNL